MNASNPSISPECEFWLVRHGETDWNKAGRWQGHANVPLSSRGQAQAHALADRWSRDPAALGLGPLFCSDLDRCVETAAPLGRLLGLDPQLDPRLRELDVGDWSGKIRSEIAQRSPEELARFDAEDPEARAPGGETRSEIRLRAHGFMSELADRFPDSRIVVVTHRGFIQALLPGVGLGNAECVRVKAADALTRRARLSDGEEDSTESQPL